MLLLIVALLAALIFSSAYICCRLAFRVSNTHDKNLYSFPSSPQYEPYRDTVRNMVNAALSIPYEDVYISSFDGLRLHGKFYAASPDAPVQIMFHGYRSVAERDFCGGLRVAVSGGYNVLLVDQRAHGESEGKYLSFGIKERYDCLSWANYAAERFGKDAKILLYGMSMGASSVLMASALPLPPSVVGIAADCAYSSPSEIVAVSLKRWRLPYFPIYQLLRLGGIIFCGFDLESASVTKALEHCSTPVLFVHGEDDHIVPCEMGHKNFEHCACKDKTLLTVPGAGHGLSFLVDEQTYLKALDNFTASVLN